MAIRWNLNYRIKSDGGAAERAVRKATDGIEKQYQVTGNTHIPYSTTVLF